MNENSFNDILTLKGKCILYGILHYFCKKEKKRKSCICSGGIYHIELKSLKLNLGIFRFNHEYWTILIINMMYTRSQTTQIWWLANME
jgi:hypothetical protein